MKLAPEFGQMELMLIKENKSVFFRVTPHAMSYSQEFGLYEVQEASEKMLSISAELCLDYYPLPAYILRGTRVISLKHSILDTE